MTVRQQKALLALAGGSTLKQAAASGGYRYAESVHRLARSPMGKSYLDQIKEQVNTEGIFSIRERLQTLAAIAKSKQFSEPETAVAAVKEYRRIAR
jgi:hypothetical protein